MVPHDPSPPTRRGRRIACRQCRQAKIRCDLENGTTPCKRCGRMGQSCQIDSEFKRVNKRARLEELEDEVRQLRSSVSHLPISPPQPVQQTPILIDRSLNLNSEAPNSTSQAPLNYEINTAAWAPTSVSDSRCLENVCLSSSQIETLFRIYFTLYHPLIPLLDPLVSSNEYFGKCPLLFWVIVYVSSRYYTAEPHVVIALASPLKKLLWETISTPPHNWYIVQSISLLSMWPIPTSSLSTDMTPVLVNIAQTIAMQLGLHQPEAIQDFSRTKRKLSPAEIYEVVRTWSICYISSQSIFTNYGLTLASSDQMIDRICDENNTYPIPEVIKHQLLIYRFSGRVSNYMSNRFPHSSQPGENSSVLGLLEQEFASLSRYLGDTITVENEILLSGVGLQLYVFYLLDSGKSLNRKVGLIRAFDMSKDLLQKLQQLDTASNFIKYCPSEYFRTIFLAAVFILHLADSSFSSILDVEGGKVAFNTALLLMRRISLEDNDMPGRISKILAQLWSLQGSSEYSKQEPHLKLKTRLSASLVHDQMWKWRERFGGQGTIKTFSTNKPEIPAQDNQTDNKQPEENSYVSLPSDSINNLSFEDVFNVEMMSLLPFEWDDLPDFGTDFFPQDPI